MENLSRREFLQTALGALASSALLTSCALPASQQGTKMIFPGAEWPRCQPEAVGMDGDAIAKARDWALQQAAGEPHGAIIIRQGRLVAEWYKDTTAETQHPMASVCKSFFCLMLGIALAEQRIRSIDDR